MLLADKPPVLGLQQEVRNLEVTYDRATERMRATWLTTLPAKCTLHCEGQERDDGQEQEHEKRMVGAPALGQLVVNEARYRGKFADMREPLAEAVPEQRNLFVHFMDQLGVL